MAALTTSPRTADTILAMIRMSTRGFARKPSSSLITAPRRRPAGSFGPTRSRRRRASSLVKPSSEDWSRARSSSAERTAAAIGAGGCVEWVVAVGTITGDESQPARAAKRSRD